MSKCSRLSFIDRAPIGLLAVASVLTLGFVELAPRPSRNVAIVFAPWVRAGEAMKRVAAADGSLVRLGALPFVLVAHPEAADFPAKMMKQGALLVLDAQAVGGCSNDLGSRP